MINIEKAIEVRSLRIARFDYLSDTQYSEMRNWCEECLGPGGLLVPGSRWWFTRPSFYFDNDGDYLLFKLRWA